MFAPDEGAQEDQGANERWAAPANSGQSSSGSGEDLADVRREHLKTYFKFALPLSTMTIISNSSYDFVEKGSSPRELLQMSVDSFSVRHVLRL